MRLGLPILKMCVLCDKGDISGSNVYGKGIIDKMSFISSEANAQKRGDY